jgi:polysaccharide export outer membrane protein
MQLSPCSNHGRPKGARAWPSLQRMMRQGLTAATAVTLTACSSLGGSGPSTASINRLDGEAYAGQGITLVDINSATLKRINAVEQSRTFASLLQDSDAQAPVIGAGDMLDISVWEAAPSVLFGAAAEISSSVTGAQNRTVLQQVVNTDGSLSVPFAGRLFVAGRTPAEVERDIVRRLARRANDPQVIVRLAQNDARNVTVLGEVAASRRVPIGPRGERLLDIIASAGGSRQPVGQTTVQITRSAQTAAMPLERVVLDPQQNIRMLPDDVVTVLHQPYSFIALGAIAKNAEIPFEGKGISLAQALARTGGLRDDRANIRGVFIFRLETQEALETADAASARKTEQGRIPVVYRLNLSDASGFFAAQDFMLHDKDVLYVSTAPGADLQRFLNTISSLAFSAISIGNIVNTGSPN